ncbi:MAG TPA: VWA domain-containing protein [Nannocystaceae bacterium]|nr:VWA domain-containing protein [Nannocystaceae bacterium]
MSLLAPALLLGLLGLAIPIAAHLLGREPPRTVELASLRFLLADEPAVTRRRSLQDRLLLLVRILLLALAVLVLARPASFDKTGLAIVAEPHDAIVLVDGSAGMTLRIGDEAAIEHAMERTEMLLGSLPGGTRVGLATSDPEGPVLEPTADLDRVRASLREWIDRGAPRLGAWTMAEALPRAAELLRDVEVDRKRVVYAVGDATAGGLGSLPTSAGNDVTVVPIPVTAPDATPPSSVGITDVDWTPAPDLDPRAVRIRATVHRHGGDDSVLTVPITLAIDGIDVARSEVSLTADERAPLEFTHTLLGEAEFAAATIAIDIPDDPLPIDDRRHLWLSADDAISVTVVNGDPSELRAHDEVFFLATAVGVTDREQRLRLASLAPDQLEGRIREKGERALAGIDVLVLANVRAPAEDIAPILLDAVERGMGLWITVGDRVDPEAYNARLGAALPLRLREVVQVGTAPGRTAARVEGFAPPDLAHPMFRGMGGELGLSSARVRKVVLCDPDPARDAAIAVAYTNGAPALLTRSYRAGRVALLTTSVDRDWADLPLRPGFVPLAAAVLGWLGDIGSGARASRIFVGEPRPLRGDATMVVVTPDGRELTAASTDEGDFVFRETFTPGHYSVKDGDELQTFVVAVDPRESDTHWQDIASSEPEGGGRVAIAVPRWRTLVLVLALLIACESLIRRVRRRDEHRPDA